MQLPRSLCRAIFAVLIVVGVAPAAFAQGPFFVNSVADEVDSDPGDGACLTASLVCTLRAAIMEANAFEGSDRDQILLDMPGTYTLTLEGTEEDDALTGDLDINGDLDITGVGPADIIIDANGIDRVFHIRFGQVVLASMTIRGGVTADTDPNGGGGILVDVDDPDVEGLIVVDAVIRDNVSQFEGGGIDLFNGNLSIFASTLTANEASCGGGIHHFGEFLSLQNVTVSGNSVTCEGGGLLDEGFGETFITHSTFAFNLPENIFAAPVFSFVLSNSLLVQSTGQENCFIIPVGDDIDGGGNFVGGSFSCDTMGITAGAELIEPLTDDPTSGHPVHRPLANNPAINGGIAGDIDGGCLALVDPVTLLFNPVDQRGLPRPSDGDSCDSGAIEVVALAFTSGPVPDATWNAVYSGHTFVAEGEPALTFELVDGALPTGMTLAASGALTGTPTAFSPAPFDFTVRATSGLGQTVDLATSITVAGAVISLTGDPPDASWNVPYSFPFSATGNGALSFLITEGAVPAGLSLSSAGVLSGTPNGLGPAAFTVTVSDASGQIETLAASMNVTGTAPTISGTPPGATWGSAYAFDFSGTGNGTLSYAMTAGALPTGVLLSSTGSLSGTPTVVGSFNFTVTLTDQTSQVVSLPTSLTVTGTPLSITGTPPTGAYGQSYTFGFSSTGNGARTFAITAGALPANVMLSPTGTLNGVPLAVGTFNFTVTLTDAANETFSLPRSILITGTPISITGAPPSGVVGTAYAFSFIGTGNGLLTYTLDAGALPPGIGLSPTGTLSGTPGAEGIFPISVRITDATAQTMAHAAALVIQATPPPPPPPPPPGGEGGGSPPPPPANAPPVVTGLTNFSIEENRPVPPIAITLADDYTGPDQLVVTVVPGDASILSGVSITGTGSARTLNVTLAEDREGQASVTLVVHDGTLSTTTTARITVTPAPVPNPPTNFTGVPDGDAMLFSWQGPVTGPVPTFFVLEGGNQTRTRHVAGGQYGASHEFPHRRARWHLVFPRAQRQQRRHVDPVRGDHGDDRTGGDEAGAPHGLVASAEGLIGRLAWQPPASGGPVDAWQIELGSAHGLSDRGVLQVPANMLAVQGAIPQGQYFARVRGINHTGSGPASNEASFVVGAVAPCALGIADPPVLLPATVANRLVTLTWRPPTNSPVTRYRIVVGSAPGLADLITFDLGPVTSFAAVAPPGQYLVSLLAGNDCGTSLPSNTIVVEVP